jgi:hypothetical protein
MYRRLASVAALALVGGLALTGCQNAPSVAAQIGDFSITNERVDQIVDQIDGELATARKAQADPTAAPTTQLAGLAKEQIGGVRANVVQLAVFDEVARRMADDKHLTLPAQDYKASAEQYGLSESNPYVKLVVDSDGYRTLLLSSVTAKTPTEAELKSAYQRIAVVAGDQLGAYEDVKPQLLAFPEFGQGLALRTEMQAALGKYNVVVNPRYQPLDMPLIAVSNGQVVLVSVSFSGEASPAVSDLPPPVVAPSEG